MTRQLLVAAVGAVALALGVGCTKAPEPAPHMTNDDLDRAVTAKINSDSTLVTYKIGVDADADKNSVTLSGSVPTEGLRMKAVEAAKSENAELVVVDKIDVKPGDVERKDYNDDIAREERNRASELGESIGDSLDDAWIHTKVRTKLMGDWANINVDVTGNVVTLRGDVATRDDKRNAEEAAKTTDGVKSVRNRLVIKPAS